MNEKEINTNNYYIKYSDDKYNKDLYCENVTDNPNFVCKNLLVIELYRLKLYNKLKKKLIKLIKEYCDINKLKYDNKQSNENKFSININFFIDIYSIIIIKMENKKDVLFNDISPFKKSNIEEYLINNKCINIDKIHTDLTIKLLPKMDEHYIRYYKRLLRLRKKLFSIKYKINYEIIDQIVLLSLELDNEYIERLKFKEIKYRKKIKIPLHVFNHLIKLFNNRVMNDYISTEILDDIVIEYIYMIYIRYMIISNGNNQASIMPSFKKLLKEKLNIKVELFGSPINTSMTTFGSLFYDIEWVFGSIGNYFNTKIIKGYYEINPPFDLCLINNVLNKSLNELNEANNNKNSLLFLLIIPLSYFKIKNFPNELNKYVTFDKILSKEEFPYIRYDRKFKNTKVSAIVDTRIIICNTSYISSYVNTNITDFSKLLKLWITKKTIKNN